MRQVFQSLSDGTTEVLDVPAPQVTPGHVLIRTQASIISAGTERMLVDFGRANLLDKARQQPDKVKQVIDKVKTDGLGPTIDAVRSRLGQPITLGYANAGVVLAVVHGVDDLKVGDFVASNGQHAEVVSVPRNLVVKVPARGGISIDPEAAAFAPIGAVALQGIRLAEPTIGERFVVTGLGLIGLLTVQLLRAHGCQVLGLDFDADRLALAEQFGADVLDLSGEADPIAAGWAFSDGRGVDGVIITASTQSSEPMHEAAQMCRKRGRVVLVGVTGLDLQRADFYEKELTFQVSCSYGPGRYDPEYEDKGNDYPEGFVRWTAGRNFEAFLDLVADGRVDTRSLVSHRYDIGEAAGAYDDLAESGDVLGISLAYPEAEAKPDDDLLLRTVHVTAPAPNRPSRGRVAVIGAGNYTRQVLLPALANTPATLDTVVSRGGASAAQAAKDLGFSRASTDIDAVLVDDAIDTVFITTRHDTHADLTLRALQAGKHVFVEKPLAIHRDELEEIAELYGQLAESGDAPLLTVGFNRRFSPLTFGMRRLLEGVQHPKNIIITVNAGELPADHWTQDPQVGGGRILGEACHFIDLARHLVDSPISSVHSQYLDSPTRDTASISLDFSDGSTASVHYIAIGSKDYPKERVEVFVAGRVLQLDNFRGLYGFGWADFKSKRLRKQDKGHRNLVAAFVRAVQHGDASPIPPDELIEVSATTLNARGA